MKTALFQKADDIFSAEGKDKLEAKRGTFPFDNRQAVASQIAPQRVFPGRSFLIEILVDMSVNRKLIYR